MKTVRYKGKRIGFPDDMSGEEIVSILSEKAKKDDWPQRVEAMCADVIEALKDKPKFPEPKEPDFSPVTTALHDVVKALEGVQMQIKAQKADSDKITKAVEKNEKAIEKLQAREIKGFKFVRDDDGVASAVELRY